MNRVIELLTDHGADLDAENRRGETPAALAVYADGIAGDRYVREATVELLRTLEDAAPAHPAAPHAHPEARELTNPTAGTRESVAAGAAAYATHCAACHGSTGRGDGALAAAAAAYGPRPSNLADPTWQHGGSDGEIFVAIRDGIGPDRAMDAFRDRLATSDRWNLVNFLRSLRLRIFALRYRLSFPPRVESSVWEATAGVWACRSSGPASLRLSASPPRRPAPVPRSPLIPAPRSHHGAQLGQHAAGSEHGSGRPAS